jgi:hypothetical protein
MYDTHILTDVGAMNIWADGKPEGFAVNITINYYRGLPLCCVDEITLFVDGEQIPYEDMYLQHAGHTYEYLDILKDDFPEDFYWKYGDYLRVCVRKEGGIAQGVHKVKLQLGTRRSYTPTLLSTCEKALIFA